MTIYQIGGIMSTQFILKDLIFGWIMKDNETGEIWFIKDLTPLDLQEVFEALPQWVVTKIRKDLNESTSTEEQS